MLPPSLFTVPVEKTFRFPGRALGGRDETSNGNQIVAIPAATVAVSLPSSAVRPDASSLPASAPQAVGAVVPAAHAAFPQKEEECVGAAKARLSKEAAAVQQDHSGWARACSVALSAYGWSPGDPAERSARLSADDWAPADRLARPPAPASIPAGHSATADSARLSADASIPADHSAKAGPAERRHSRDALPAHHPLVEPRPDWLADYKASLPL